MLVGSGKAPSKNSRLLHGDEVNRDSYLSAKPSTGNELAYDTTARGASGEAVRIFVARDSRKVPGIVDSLDREWWGAWRRGCGEPELRITRYYPYYFQSWKITAPKTFGRMVRVILYTGVNGMNRSVGPATEWPAGEEREVGRGEIISPQTPWKEAGQLSQEYIEKFVMRRYRPSRSADIQQEAFSLIYVPYYVYAKRGQLLKKAALIEASTGALGRVKDVSPVLQSIANNEIEGTVSGSEGR